MKPLKEITLEGFKTLLKQWEADYALLLLEFEEPTQCDLLKLNIKRLKQIIENFENDS